MRFAVCGGDSEAAIRSLIVMTAFLEAEAGADAQNLGGHGRNDDSGRLAGGVSNAIQGPELQGFLGSLVGLRATKGVFVTTSSFTKGATVHVRNLRQRVVLIDGERLTTLMIEHGVGTRLQTQIDIQRVDEDFFTED